MDVGSRIRRIRMSKKLTLSDIADKVSLSVSYLSQIENGKVDISLSHLQSIANALGTNVADFFTQPKNSDYCIIRKEERKYYEDSNGISEAPLFTHDDSLLETAIINLPPRTGSSCNSMHEGEEFTFVISGNVIVWLDNEEFSLKEGDIIFYNSMLAHRWENKSSASTKILVVNTPKTF